ncbi:MAG: erythromycin biosynthesis sensory transduction protein eryC1 [Acidobacteria bacterium]|nr:MAG: erythromycin biosynthesis sensory transduction protein eryC1 [Acidobacteriota bacterium]
MNGRNAIPFLDLVTTHRELRLELTEVFHRALDAASFIGGPMVEQFEHAFAEFCGTKHCVGVGSGTDALRFALMAASIDHGDIVITAPNTFIATTEAITQAGGGIAFVDINAQTYTLDPEKLLEFIEKNCEFDAQTGKLTERATRRRVAAIVPVHLYGQMADMDSIMDLAAKYNLVVIEDACQAHGAEYFSKKANAWKKAGSIGKAAAFSFYPGKNLGACGEGGAITTDDESLALRMKMIRDHGQAQKYYHDIEGYNGRLDSMQAGWLSVKLRHLGYWNESRRRLAHRYHELFADAGDAVVVPVEAPWMRGVYHLYVIRVPDRDGLRLALADAGIGTGIHYPIPLHLQKAYEHLGYRQGAFPVTERVAGEILSIPMFPQLSHGQQDLVVTKVREFLDERVAMTP